jgi:GNAT superfamily N-acetyltransferase
VIRSFRPEDADAVATLLDQDEIPEGVTGDGIRHWIASQPERALAAAWVADEEGEPAGWARARLRWATSAEGVGEVTAFVAPGSRRRGLGAALYDAAHAHLLSAGARVLESWATGDEGGRFLAARGFEGVREQMVLRLGLATADVSRLDGLRAALELEGYELVPLAAVSDRVEGLYAVDAGATADVPGTFREDDVRFDDWVTETLGHPQLTHEGSFVVLSGGEPVAHALLHVAPASRLAANEMTATRRDHRRRGLARLAKLAGIAWARDHSYQSILTGCDQDNAGMLHLNRSLGYRQIATETEYLLEDLR